MDFGGKNAEKIIFEIWQFWIAYDIYNNCAHLMLDFGIYTMLSFEENWVFRFCTQKITPFYEVKLSNKANVQKIPIKNVIIIFKEICPDFGLNNFGSRGEGFV